MGATHRASKGGSRCRACVVGPPAKPDLAIRSHAAHETHQFSHAPSPSYPRREAGGRCSVASALGQAHGLGYLLSLFCETWNPLTWIESRGKRRRQPCWKHPCRLGRSARRNRGMSMKIGKEGMVSPMAGRGALNKGTPACQTIRRYI